MPPFPPAAWADPVPRASARDSMAQVAFWSEDRTVIGPAAPARARRGALAACKNPHRMRGLQLVQEAGQGLQILPAQSEQEAALFLAAGASGWITGVILEVAGGAVMG